MNKPLVLFFDLDGTLTESAPGIMRCFRYALDRLGISPNGKNLRVVVGPPLRDSFLDSWDDAAFISPFADVFFAK